MGSRRTKALLMRQQLKTTATDARGKPRGGASHACPRCDSRTEVVDTRRQETGPGVRRVRRCVKCRHEFTTTERMTRR
jgi:hypothetical protein